MLKKDPWWLFLVVFVLMIAGIQTLGWWDRAASAQSPDAQAKEGPAANPAALRHLHCAPKHWRGLVMQH